VTTTSNLTLLVLSPPTKNRTPKLRFSSPVPFQPSKSNWHRSGPTVQCSRTTITSNISCINSIWHLIKSSHSQSRRQNKQLRRRPMEWWGNINRRLSWHMRMRFDTREKSSSKLGKTIGSTVSPLHLIIHWRWCKYLLQEITCWIR
jgi:hypothetical protein